MERASAVIAEAFVLFIKVSTEPFANVGSNGVSRADNLLAYCVFSEIVPRRDQALHPFAKFHRKFVDLEISEIHSDILHQL